MEPIPSGVACYIGQRLIACYSHPSVREGQRHFALLRKSAHLHAYTRVTFQPDSGSLQPAREWRRRP